MPGRPSAWPLVVLGAAQAAVIAMVVVGVVDDYRGVRVANAGAGHGAGHGGTPAGPAPIVGEPLPHYAGLVAFAAYAVLFTLPAAVVVARSLVSRRRRADDLVARLVFAFAAGVAGAVAAVATSWVAVRATTGGLDVLPEVAAVGAAGAFRYSVLLALVVAVIGGARWLADHPGPGKPADVPAEPAQ
ncbi:hypothetical protein B0I31_112166 [Saccharothrix carnea]|uniref:Uncharacterized protein n=1 Tax=Saccharothrix carnea TaxID=1280637 RepID=A0A2P8I2K7_SACCR|nr:hypothetical protein [Saccharothrix carnea]PSL52697.1 hypothetical protein B0I31_112166 [Saccharothrix carnea]